MSYLGVTIRFLLCKNLIARLIGDHKIRYEWTGNIKITKCEISHMFEDFESNVRLAGKPSVPNVALF